MSIQFIEFEQPIAELEAKIEELRLVNQGGEFDVSIEEEITRCVFKQDLFEKGKSCNLVMEHLFEKIKYYKLATHHLD